MDPPTGKPRPVVVSCVRSKLRASSPWQPWHLPVSYCCCSRSRSCRSSWLGRGVSRGCPGRCPGRGPGAPVVSRLVSRLVSRSWPHWCPGGVPIGIPGPAGRWPGWGPALGLGPGVPVASRLVPRPWPRWCPGWCPAVALGLGGVPVVPRPAVAGCCPAVAPSVFQVRSKLFQSCPKCVPMLFQVCMLLRHCSKVVQMLFQCCSDGGPRLLQFSSDVVSV